MVNENRMVEWGSTGGDLRPAEHLRPELSRCNGSTPITPQLQHSNPSPPLGLGLVEYILPLFSPVPGKSKNGKCAIARRGAASFCFYPLGGVGMYKNRQPQGCPLRLNLPGCPQLAESTIRQFSVPCP